MTDNYLERYLRVEVLNEIIETQFFLCSDVDQMEKIHGFASRRYDQIQSWINKQEELAKVAREVEEVTNTKGNQKTSHRNKVIHSNFNKVGYKIPKFEKLA